jgi:Protein of unknown function (DUF3099)
MVTGGGAHPKGEHRSAAHSAWPVSVITDARPGASEEMWRRQKRYMITMGFRTACFLAMLVVPGAWRWVLFAGAVFLPYVAVIFANQADRKGTSEQPVERGEPESLPQLTADSERIIPGEQDLEPDGADGVGGAAPGDAGRPSDSDGGRRVA